jgi:FtsH-binding integral membrane protein
MKNLLLIAGFILIVLNTLIGLMISKYSPFNYLMVDLSLLISTVLIYLFSNSNISDGYKIGFTVLFAITGLAKVVCSIVAPQHFQDNFLIVVVLGLISFEALCLLSAFAMKKFA